MLVSMNIATDINPYCILSISTRSHKIARKDAYYSDFNFHELQDPEVVTVQSKPFACLQTVNLAFLTVSLNITLERAFGKRMKTYLPNRVN